MNLVQAVQLYIQSKRSEGHPFVRGEQILLSFAKRSADLTVASVRVHEVSAFLDISSTFSNNTWRIKYGLLKHFFEYWAVRGELEILRMPTIQPPSPPAFGPHIYSRAELRSMLKSARRSQRHTFCSIDPQTLRTLLILLYATGIRVGEALRLEHKDVNRRRGLIIIRDQGGNVDRELPIGHDLKEILREYVRRTGSRQHRFFTTKEGSPLNQVTLQKTFQRLRRLWRVTAQPGVRFTPRMHDLRYTFAVHRIEGWLKQGADLNRMLPALAAYMGQVGLGSTERYLTMTPQRFRQHLLKLSPERPKGHWRDNPRLMKFLAQL